MFCEEVAISVESVGKCYHIYDRPSDRLKQMLWFGRRRYFREFWAVHDVSFTIGRGETVGIIGRNGSGKSTLLQMICGTVAPTNGSVRASGRVAALLELGAGFNPEFTGRENVLLNASILGFPVEEMRERMDNVIAFAELEEFIDQPVKTYSSGMFARLAFSIAINVEPDILVIDEALAVGDARFVAKCMRRIQDIKAKGVTILFVSHDVASVRTLCERAIWIDKGRLVNAGDVFPVTGRYMEFLFRDESISADSAVDAAKNLPAAHLPSAGESVALSEDEARVEQPSDFHVELRPVTHWGSHKGLILSAAVCDAVGVRRDVHKLNSDIEVRIDVRIPTSISRDHLSVAISIKDLKGTDLIVSTTRDYGMKLPDAESFNVTFGMKNSLVTGKYLLVAAVENREYRDIHYFEYIEGAHYFSSLADEHIFGIFQPSIQQHIRVM
ncbi:ABC transporter ATP-binding protein [Burkholderia gladioli]|uniref:ABC transporter ATP-binding protein n=1 Tax=Burkholderia gladioli TaxID=28095 RepID=UPI001ABA3E87|nr:ABC transporter ATP-binding protein [Burkholderia gladioli]